MRTPQRHLPLVAALLGPPLGLLAGGCSHARGSTEGVGPGFYVPPEGRVVDQDPGGAMPQLPSNDTVTRTPASASLGPNGGG